MWILIIMTIIGIVIYHLSKPWRETIRKVNATGGMDVRYARLIQNILDGHKDCQIIGGTRTYIRLGVSNLGGTIMFHIQQCSNNTVMIDYDVSNNPVIPSFNLRFTFPDTMDQDEMMERIAMGIQNKLRYL